MSPVRQNPIQRTVSLFICVCIALCTIVARNIAHNRPDSFPPYPPDNHHCLDDVYLREGGITEFTKKQNYRIANALISNRITSKTTVNGNFKLKALSNSTTYAYKCTTKSSRALCIYA